MICIAGNISELSARARLPCKPDGGPEPAWHGCLCERPRRAQYNMILKTGAYFDLFMILLKSRKSSGVQAAFI